MPGAWEYKPPEVLVAILTRGLVSTRWALGLRGLQLPGASNIILLSGMPFDHARNEAAAKCLQDGYQWLLFLDDDVIPPADAFERLRQHGKDIVSGLYYRRAEPVCPVAMVENGKGRVYAEINRPGELIEVDLVGAGMLLIHRRVFETMPRPWFEWLLDRPEIPEAERTSEDYHFCRKAKRNHGFKIFLDTFVQCLHVGYGRSELGGRFVPLD